MSHVSGHANLYGSDFSHQHYVTVTIHTSELRRDLARDWHFDRKELIEVAMSEAQWATFVSTPNRQGPCCTLRSFNGEQTPGLPLRNSTQIFSDEVREKLTSSVERLRQHRADMAAATSKLSKTAQAEVLSSIDKAIQEIESNLPFVVKSFGEHVEDTIEKAKIEVNAYMTNAIARAGITALSTGGAAPPLQIDATPSKE